MSSPLILPYRGECPTVDSTAFIAQNAVLIGRVTIGADSSVWYSVVIRGDVNFIQIGRRTNIQDGTVVHVNGVPSYPTIIGDEVTIGHNVTLHGCTIGNRVLIGMNAVVLNGCTIGDNCMIGAGSVLKQGMEIPSGSLVVGSPAVIKRPLAEAEIAFLGTSAQTYVALAQEYHHVSV